MWRNLNDSAANVSGGFLNDSRSNLNDGEKRNVKRGQNAVPVRIRHLINSSGDVKIGDILAHIVTIVGIIRNVEKATTKEVYQIEDDSGTITALRWLHANKECEDAFKLNTYVRVHGHLREQNGAKHVLVLKMWALTSLNELTNHLLEVTYMRLKMKKMNQIENERVNGTRMENVAINDDNISGLTKEQAIIFKIIQAENNSENGIERDVIKRRVPKNILSSVDNIIDFLTCEGHVFATLNENYFKAT